MGNGTAGFLEKKGVETENEADGEMERTETRGLPFNASP